MNNPFHDCTLPELKIMHTKAQYRYPEFHLQAEFLFVKQGTISMMVNEKTYELTSGDCLLIFPNCIHSILSVSDDNDVVLAACSQQLAGEFWPLLTAKYPTCPVLHKEEMPLDSLYALHSLMKKRDILGAAEEWAFYDIQHAAILLQLFFYGFLSRLELHNKKASAALETSREVIRYITEKYAEPLSLNDLAKHLGLSRFQVSRIFSNDLHIGFHEFLSTVRIKKAKQLLSGSKNSITSIALNCGFNSSRTFNRIFLEKTGKTPREFRYENNPDYKS